MGVKSEISPSKIVDTKFKAHGILKDPYYIYKIITPYNYNQIINRKLFEDIKYPEGYFYEDVGTLYKIIDKCKRAYIHDKSYYTHSYTENSILTAKSFKNFIDKVIMYYNFLLFIRDKIDVNDLAFQLTNLTGSISKVLKYNNEYKNLLLNLYEISKDPFKFRKHGVIKELTF